MKYILHGSMPICLAKIIEGISYKPGWLLYITAHKDNVYTHKPYAYTINAQCTVEDVVTRARIELHGPGVTIHADHIEEKMVVDLIFNSIQRLECHEMEEQFSYNGHRIFDPHRREHQEKLFELAATHPELDPKAMRLTCAEDEYGRSLPVSTAEMVTRDGLVDFRNLLEVQP